MHTDRGPVQGSDREGCYGVFYSITDVFEKRRGFGGSQLAAGPRRAPSRLWTPEAGLHHVVGYVCVWTYPRLTHWWVRVDERS